MDDHPRGSARELIYTAVQSKTAVTAYFSSDEILPFGFAEQHAALQNQQAVFDHLKSKQLPPFVSAEEYGGHLFVRVSSVSIPTSCNSGSRNDRITPPPPPPSSVYINPYTSESDHSRFFLFYHRSNHRYWE